MPSASKYIVDINKISKPGNVATGGIYIGTGSGNRESLYAVRGTGSGSVVIYDKVLYELSVDNISNIEPNAQTVTFTYSSKRTHGNLTDVDTLGINPTTSAITANHSTASTKTTTCTVNQSVTNNGTLTGNSVNVTVTQIKNYPTGLTLTISPKSTIPASGGSISSALTNYTYSVTAAYKSGSSSAVTSDSNTTITANVTGVTANSKGTTASTETDAGTIRFTATYICNGKTVTTSQTVTIKQDKNAVINTNYSPSNYEALISIGNGITAGGGSATVTASARHLAYDLYDSGSYNNQHYVADGVTVTEVSDNNNRYSYSNGTLTHSSMTTNLTTDSCTLRATNNTSTSATKDASVSVTNTRWHEGDTPSNYVATISIGNGMVAKGGSATVTTSAYHTNTFTWAYTSGSKVTGQTETITDTADVTIDSNGNNRFSYSNGTVSHSNMTTNVTTDTVTLRVRNHSNTGTTNTASKSIQNKVENSDYNASNSNYTASISIGSGLSAAGGSATVTASGSHTHTYYYYYTSESTSGPYTRTDSDGASWAITENGNSRFSKNGNTLNHSSMTTNVTTDYVTVKATNNNNSSATASTRTSVSNAVTNSDYNSSNSNYTASVSIGDGMTAKGGSATVTASGSHTHTYYYLYTSTSTSGPYTRTDSDGASWEITSNGNNRFSKNGNTLNHSNMTTNVTTDTVTVKATNSNNSSATATASKSISNAVTNSDYNASNSNYTASISIGSGLSAAGGSATVTASGSHTHTYYYLYTSESTSGPYTSTPSDGASWAITENGNSRFSKNGNTLNHSSMTTNVTTDYVTVKATNNNSSSATASTRTSVSNAVTNSDYNASNSNYTASISIGSGLSAAGGSATVTASGSHTHTYYYLYTSTSTSGPYYSYPSDGASWEITENGNSRFSKNGNTLNHSSMGTSQTTDYVTVKATNSNSSSATASTRTSVTNGVKSTSWGDLDVSSASVSWSVNPIAIGGGTSYATTGGTVKQYRVITFDSGSNDGGSWPAISASVNYNPASFSAGSRVHVVGDTTHGTTTATWTGNSSKTASKTSGQLGQTGDSLYSGTKTTSTSLTTDDTSNIPAAGGTRTVTWYITQSTNRYWSSDGAYYDTQTTHTGSTLLSTTACSVSTTTLSNGGSATVTIGANTSTASTRSVSVKSFIGGDTQTWTQEKAVQPGTLFSIMNSTLYNITGSFTGVEGSSSMNFGESFNKNPGYRQEYTFDTPVYIKSIHMLLQNIPSGGSNVIYLKNMSTTQSYLTLTKVQSAAGYVTYSNENCNYQLDPNSTMYEIIVG